MSEFFNDEFISGLTVDQRQAIKEFHVWFEKNVKDEPFVLSGYAGSGKTFLAMKFLQFVESKKLCWTVAAPTHKAVGVLRKALRRDDLRSTWYPSTIHRLLRLKLKRKGNVEICEETKQTANSLDDLSLVIIDESSMIDSHLLEIIINCASTSGTRLVFVGDPAQLPPIGEAKSSVFSMNIATNAYLNEVVRHEGPILKLSSCIREGSIPCSIPPCFPILQSSKGLVGSIEKNLWLEKAKSYLKTASEDSNPDGARILCYTNKVLERLVPHARRAIYGEMADQLPVLPGEILITRRPVMKAASTDNVEAREEPNMLISSNREIIVSDITPDQINVKDFGLIDQVYFSTYLIDTLVAKVKYGEREFSVRLLPQVGTSSRTNLDNILNRLSELAKESETNERRRFWRIFFAIRDSFASVGPASVLTVHRSQGSTFENVFVSSDVFWPNDLALRKQLVYVAVSRASKELWMVGSHEQSSCQEIWEDYFNSYL